MLEFSVRKIMTCSFGRSLLHGNLNAVVYLSYVRFNEIIVMCCVCVEDNGKFLLFKIDKNVRTDYEP